MRKHELKSSKTLPVQTRYALKSLLAAEMCAQRVLSAGRRRARAMLLAATRRQLVWSLREQGMLATLLLLAAAANLSVFALAPCESSL